MLRDRPIICTDLQIRTTFGFRWVGGFRKLDVRILVQELIRTPRNPMIIQRRTDFLGRECSDLGVGGWVSRNPNIVRICKSVRIIGQSLRKEISVEHSDYAHPDSKLDPLVVTFPGASNGFVSVPKKKTFKDRCTTTMISPLDPTNH